MQYNSFVLSVVAILLVIITVLMYYSIGQKRENIQQGWIFLNTTQDSIIPLKSTIFNVIVTPLNGTKPMFVNQQTTVSSSLMPCVGEMYGLFTPSTTDKIQIISFNTTSTTLLFSNSSLKYNFPYLYTNMTNCLLTLEEYLG